MEKREIKFRFWLVHIQYMTFAHNLQELANINPKFTFTDDMVPMQYTGLKDKNGIEIYEGDIVIRKEVDYSKIRHLPYDHPQWQKDQQPINEVMRDVVSLLRFGYWLRNESFGYEGEDLVSPEFCEVIGNIYEHPHLLQQSAQ